jgi:hypothetical protein
MPIQIIVQARSNGYRRIPQSFCVGVAKTQGKAGENVQSLWYV